MKKFLLYSIIILLLASSCSVRRFMPPGEKLYRGATVIVKKEPGVKTSTRILKKQLKDATRPGPNKFFLGQPYKVWWWYVIGTPKREKGFKIWLRKKLGEQPVLSSRVNAQTIAENLQSFMENTGYFHSIVKGDTVNKSYFTRAFYHAEIFPQYNIRNITWINDSSALMMLLSADKSNCIIKSGKPYRLTDIESERSRLDLLIKTKGYYFFNPDYMMAYADSTIGNHQVDIYLNIKKSIPENAKHAYTINTITIFPNYTILAHVFDSSKQSMYRYDNLIICDTNHAFKPALFKQAITYRPGHIYSSRDQNTTLNRLINLGTFKFVKNTYTEQKDTATPYRLNAFYYLTPSKRKSLQGEIDAFTKENNNIGSQLSLNWKDRNTFRGAELLKVKTYGSFEISSTGASKTSNIFRIGGEVSLTIPRFVTPFFTIKESNLYPPKTNLLIGYELFNKQSFYSQNIFRFNYQFDWKKSSNTEHTLTPVSITLLNTANITDSFYKAALINPSILTNVYSEIIMGSSYTYRFTTLNPLDRNQFFYNIGIDVAGNVAGLITGAKEPRQKTIFYTPFAQYVKLDGEMTYNLKLGTKSFWVNHTQIGIGMPYNNSSRLPIPKQYIIGGGSSMRGFPVHLLGPGTYKATVNDIKFYQSIGGDYKFLFNSELRFPLAGNNLTGAIFVDAGNIWTKDSSLFGEAGQLKKDSYKELAVSSGFGVRFDLGFLLVRLDLGIPLRKPYLPDGQRWVINQINFGNKDWRRDNLILNIAIGYPF